MLLPILHYPDPRLRNKAKQVTTVDAKLLRLLDDMLETMYNASGIGLAATQVNIPLYLVTIDISQQHDQPLYLINPKIVSFENRCESEEGCLSVPGIYDIVERAERIRYQYLDRNNQLQTTTAEGLLAVCIQHEIDHLNGKLFIDYLSVLKRQRIRKQATNSTAKHIQQVDHALPP